jgi:MbtH protein
MHFRNQSGPRQRVGACSANIGSMDELRSTRYRVVVNREAQYSIWPDDQPMPAGWRDEGTAGTRAECLAQITAVWVDLRPLSLRPR